jgi:spore coat protein U-like protein
MLCCLPVLALFVLLSATPAFAGTTANITVQANVTANCTISAGTVDFGSYDPALANVSTPLEAEGTFTVKCTKGTAATIDLSVGANASGSARRMLGGGDYLTYELYRDSGRSAVWGTGTGNNLNPYEADGGTAPNAGNRTVRVYGRVPAGQEDIGSGAYSDTVVATINF